MDEAFRIQRLTKPGPGLLDVVLDTDAYNEVDDPFALAYLIRSPERIRLLAVYAAPFLNEKVASPAEGMHKSVEEIERILRLCGQTDGRIPVRRGATAFLPEEETPVASEAAEHLIALAQNQPADRPLYVLSIGAITNVASALLLQPAIAEKIVVVWLGGHAHSWPDTCEFNMFQDYAAARVAFGCGVPFVQLPCLGVVSHLTAGQAELEQYLAGKNDLCTYLYQKVIAEEAWRGDRLWSRTIWDVAAAAWLIRPESMRDALVHSPIPSYDGHYGHSETRHMIRCLYQLDRDAIFADLFERLAAPQ